MPVSQSASQSVTVRDLHRHTRPKCHVSYHSHTRAALTCTSATIPKPKADSKHAPDTRSDWEWREAVCVARRFRHLQWHPGLGLGLGGPAAGSTAWCLLTGDQTRDGMHCAAHLGNCADPSRNSSQSTVEPPSLRWTLSAQLASGCVTEPSARIRACTIAIETIEKPRCQCLLHPNYPILGPPRLCTVDRRRQECPGFAGNRAITQRDRRTRQVPNLNV